MHLTIDALLDYQLDEPSDLLMAVEVAQLPDQRLIADNLSVWGVGPMTPVAAEDNIGRRTWTRGEGRVTARYTASVEVSRTLSALENLRADAMPLLPPEAVAYLFSSRYCEADKLENLVGREFGQLQGGQLVHAMAAWIRQHIAYVPGSSDGSTTAVDTFVSRQGVCRDFAHLLIAMTRSAGIPARMVAAYAWRLDPQDFHAVVEVWLEGAWHLVDATGLAPCEGIVRIGVGRDATDISFLTIFGRAHLIAQQVTVSQTTK